ncbi:MAG: GldG family protein [Planctomycetes bacterium]|nr:GldG family protein [Planctomycetota bacterium]
MREYVTKERKFELSDKSKQILRNLDKTVTIYSIPEIGITTHVDESKLHAWTRFKEFISELEYQSNLIKYREPSPIDVKDIQEIKEQFGEAEIGKLYVLISDGKQKKKKAIYFNELYRGDPYTGKILKFYAENMIIGAIRELMYVAKKIIYFTVGHKEYDTYPSKPTGLGRLLQYMELQENIEWRHINLLSVKTIPKDCEALYIFGAQQDFSKEEIDLLDSYVSIGGRLIVTLVPNNRKQRLKNLDDFLAKYGITVDRSIIFNPNFADRVATAVDFPNHKVNAGMQGNNLYFLNSCALKENIKASKDYVAVPIIRSDMSSTMVYQRYVKETDSFEWTQTDEGIKVLGVAVEPVIIDPDNQPLNKRFKMIVLSSTDAFTTNALRFYAVTGDTIIVYNYFVNLFKWVTEREQDILAPPKSFEEQPLVLAASDRQFVFWIVIVIMPFFGVLSGVVTYIWRRK